MGKIIKLLVNNWKMAGCLSYNFFRRLGIAIDYLWMKANRGFTLSEYYNEHKLFFYNKKGKKEFVSIFEMTMFAKKINGGRIHYFDDKLEFLCRNEQFINRDYLGVANSTLDEFCEFLNRHRVIVSKPLYGGSFGIGIKTFETDLLNDKQKEDLYHELNSCLLEEKVINCPEIKEFHPDSLNTLRVLTYLNEKGEPIPLYCGLRIGRGGSVVDNSHGGGILSRVDLNTGIVMTSAVATDGNRYLCHPDTGKQIIGFKIPCFEELIEFSKRCALNNPTARIAGWDIAIDKNYEFCLIEGNCTPNIDGMQSTKGFGSRKELKNIIKDMN